jgi:hypothetical protein
VQDDDAAVTERVKEDSEHDLALLAQFIYTELGEATAEVLALPRSAYSGAVLLRLDCMA